MKLTPNIHVKALSKTSPRYRERLWNACCIDGDGKPSLRPTCNLCRLPIFPGDQWDESHIGAPAALGGVTVGIAHRTHLQSPAQQHYLFAGVAMSKRARKGKLPAREGRGAAPKRIVVNRPAPGTVLRSDALACVLAISSEEAPLNLVLDCAEKLVVWAANDAGRLLAVQYVARLQFIAPKHRMAVPNFDFVVNVVAPVAAFLAGRRTSFAFGELPIGADAATEPKRRGVFAEARKRPSS